MELFKLANNRAKQAIICLKSYGLTAVSASHLVRDSVSHNCYSTILNVAIYII